MKCDLCGKAFNNSDELKQHKEEVHPMDTGKVHDRDEENPEIKMDKGKVHDMGEENPEIKREMPEPEVMEMPGHKTGG